MMKTFLTHLLAILLAHLRAYRVGIFLAYIYESFQREIDWGSRAAASEMNPAFDKTIM